MNEFEDLLSSVLAADVHVEPPDGLERRIKSALNAATVQPPSARRFPRQAVAAMLLAGFAAMLAVRYHNGAVPGATSNEAGSIVKPSVPGGEPRNPAVVATSPQSGSGPHAARMARSGKSVRTVVVGIAPLAVESLVIEPIEVAALASNKLTKQSPRW